MIIRCGGEQAKKEGEDWSGLSSKTGMASVAQREAFRDLSLHYWIIVIVLLSFKSAQRKEWRMQGMGKQNVEQIWSKAHAAAES